MASIPTRLNTLGYSYGDFLTKVKYTSTSGLSDQFLPIVGTLTSSSIPNKTNATELVIGTGVTSIGSSAMSRCRQLTKVFIPGTVETIGQSAFNYCTKLVDLTISEGVNEILYNAFMDCQTLPNIHIPKSVTYLQDNPFTSNGAIMGFTVSEDNPSYKEQNGLVLTKDGKTLVSGVNGNVVVPSGVETINDNAFEWVYNLSSIEIPNTVKSIRPYAFRGCSSKLKEITIPDSVTYLGWNAFEADSTLTTITIGSGVSTLYYGTFQRCTRISTLRFRSITAPQAQSGAFGSSTSYYAGRTNYSKGTNILVVPDGATGYDTGQWLDPLQDSTKCGFTLKHESELA